MIHNPIYAGPIYASVYDSRGALLTSNASTPSSVGTPDFPPPNRQVRNSHHMYLCWLICGCLCCFAQTSKALLRSHINGNPLQFLTVVLLLILPRKKLL